MTLVAPKWQFGRTEPPVFKTKYNTNGSIEPRPIRIATKGFKQIKGLDYKGTFSPVVSYESMRISLSLAASQGFEVIDGVDYTAAFIQAPLHEEVYVEQPEQLDDGRGRVLRLHRALEGLHQSGREWYLMLRKTLQDLGFTTLKSMASCHDLQRDDIRVIIPVYVDDELLLCSSRVFADSLLDKFKQRHKLRRLGATQSILSIRLTRSLTERTIELDHEQYIHGIFTRFNMNDSRPVSTPLPAGACFSKAQSPITPLQHEEAGKRPYQQAIGALLFLAHTTRPDIAYAVGVLSRYSSCHGSSHWLGVKHILRYLKGTSGLHLRLGGQRQKPEGYPDASYGDRKDDGKSTSGHALFMGVGAAGWGSKKQPVVAQYTM